MILYFDNLITNIPLVPGLYTDLDAIRDTDSSYKTKDKLSITMYMLASYAEIKWSKVIIRYELDGEYKTKKRYFEKFIRKLFPKAKIIYGRSDNLKKFQEMAKLINKFKDEWIFYAGNNDHPFVAPNTKLLYKCLKKAKELKKKHKYVSIVYSHYPEPLHMAREGNALHDIGFPNSKILEENKDYLISLFPRGFYTSIQILHKDLMNYWLFLENIENVPIKRIEYIHKFIPLKERKSQIIICPKEELCAHFDGYSQTKGTGYDIPSNVVPPLFIPEGFFKKKIKIAYGYPEYRRGWVNINPLKKKYSFEDNINGTDLMMSLEDIPLFWKKRIKKIDINKKISRKKLKKARDNKFYKIRNIYFQRNGFNFLYYEFFVLQHRIRSILKRVGLRIKLADNLLKRVKSVI